MNYTLQNAKSYLFSYVLTYFPVLFSSAQEEHKPQEQQGVGTLFLVTVSRNNS